MESQERQPNQDLTVIDIGRYITALKRKLPLILCIVTVVTGLAYYLGKQMPPVYQATTTLLIESKPKKAISIEDIVGVDASKQEYYQTQYEIMRSNRIAERVIEQFQLEKNPEFNGSKKYFSVKGSVMGYVYAIKHKITGQPSAQNNQQSPAAIKRKVLNRFKSKLTIKPIRKTQLVHIVFESHNRSTAATLANAVATAYIENNIEARILMSQEATTWINRKLEELSSKLKISEASLTEFQRAQGLVDAKGIDSLQTKELTHLTTQIANARDRRLAAQSQYTLLKSSPKDDVSSLYAISEISNHPQVRDLRLQELQQEKRVSELAKRYGPKHDKMIQAQAQLNSIQTASQKLVRQLGKGIEKEFIAAQSQEDALKQEMESKKVDFQDLSFKRSAFEKLEREVINDRKLYDLFLTRQKEAAATSDYQTAIARITDSALIPYLPAAPNIGKIVSVAAFGSLLLCVTLVILREAVRNELESPSDVEEKTGFSPIASIPKLKRGLSWGKTINASTFLTNKDGAFSEAIRSLRTRILLDSTNSDRKRFAITSSTPNEGKTTVAVNLALSLVKMEKVLLIDGDLRRPSLGKMFGFSLGDNGLSHNLLLNEPIQNCLHHHEETGLTILPSGFIPPNPQELLSSPEFSQLLAQLDSQFDKIIIDCPPALVVSDAFVLGRLTGGVLVVAKAGNTKASQLYKTITSTIQHQLKVDGVILNQTKDKSTKPAHAYYSSYSYSTKS